MARSRRDEILSIAALQFAQRGVASTTVRDIGAAAGILSGSLYHHFESKEQMVAELPLPVMERQIGHYRLIVGGDAAAAKTLRSLIKVAVAEAAQTPAAKLWGSVIERGVAGGEFRNDVDSRLVVAAMFDAVLSTTRWFSAKGPRSPDRVGDAPADLFLGGLVASPN